MLQVNRIIKMKSICGFLLFETAVVLCILNVHVIAEEFDCDLDIRIPDAIRKKCPNLGNDTALQMGHYMTEAVVDTHKRIYRKCNDSVERICNEVPAPVVRSNVGGREQCKNDLKELVCEDQRNYFQATVNDYLCPFYAAVSKIIANSDKWPQDEDTERKAICGLFEENRILCYMATRRLCDRINSAVVKYHCQVNLEKGICKRGDV